MNVHRQYLQLIRAAIPLLEEESSILTSSENIAFFRQVIQKKKDAKPPEVFSLPIPLSPAKKTVRPPGLAPSEPPPSITKEEPVEELNPSKIQKTHSLSPTSFFTLFSKIAPEIALLKEIPDDAIAKKIALRWKTKNQTAPLTLLTFSEPEPHQKFLENMTKALDVCFGSARLVQAETIEKEKQWEAFLGAEGLKLIIVCDYTLWQLNGLMQFYKEIPNQASRTLGKIPLFLLPDLSLYLKDPLLKRSLWKALCQKIL